MMKFLQKSIKQQTMLEEWFNSISHGLGALFGIFALFILLHYGLQQDSFKAVLSVVIYSISLVMLYLSSTLYHKVNHDKYKRIFKILDHSSIYLLIAGSYTPFLIVLIGGYWGWGMFAVIWSIAICGILFKCFFAGKFKGASVFFYLLMGWMIVIALKPFLMDVPFNAIMWLLGGGLLYSFGTIFYILDGRYYFFHFIWHLFVLGGSVFHFIAILNYVV